MRAHPKAKSNNIADSATLVAAVLMERARFVVERFWDLAGRDQLLVRGRVTGGIVSVGDVLSDRDGHRVRVLGLELCHGEAPDFTLVLQRSFAPFIALGVVLEAS
jgi:hypothetical protein